nr:MAG TPA: hypothetical protein [Caudoviricetes sp.]
MSFCHLRLIFYLHKNERLSFLFIFFVAYGCKGSCTPYSPDNSSICLSNSFIFLRNHSRLAVAFCIPTLSDNRLNALASSSMH